MENEKNTVVVEEEMTDEQSFGELTETDIADASEFVNEEFEKYFDEYLKEDANNENGEEAPTTEPESTATENDEEAEEAPTTEPKTESESKIKVAVKRDRKEYEVEIGRDELPGLWQKAENYDRLNEKFMKQSETLRNMEAIAKQMGYASAEEMINESANRHRDERVQELVDEGTSRVIAEDFIDRQMKGRTEKVEPKQDAATDETPEAPKDYKTQIAELFEVRPDLRGRLPKLPDEVVKAVITENIPIRTAYAEWEARQAKAEHERLKEENKKYAQAAEKATKAPVRGTTDTNTEKGLNPLIAAFDKPW